MTKHTALYPRMWEKPGEKCLHPQSQGPDRIPLYCARPKGHDGNHLHDVHPDHQR